MQRPHDQQRIGRSGEQEEVHQIVHTGGEMEKETSRESNAREDGGENDDEDEDDDDDEKRAGDVGVYRQ